MSTGWDRRWRALLVPAVLLALAGMHALVVPPAAPGPVTAPVPVAAPMMPAHDAGVPGPGPQRPAGDPAGHGERDGGHGGHGGGAAHLVHLCLAVLAVTGLLLLAAWVFLGRLPFPGPPVPGPRRVDGRPPARPPPVPRRLALLCVLRN